MYKAQRTKYGCAPGPQLTGFFMQKVRKKLHLLNILLDKLYITAINYMNNAWRKWMNIIPMKST